MPRKAGANAVGVCRLIWLERVMVLSDFVTAREREPGEGERGSPAAGKGVVAAD